MVINIKYVDQNKEEQIVNCKSYLDCEEMVQDLQESGYRDITIGVRTFQDSDYVPPFFKYVGVYNDCNCYEYHCAP